VTPETTREEGIRRMQSPQTLEEVQRYAVGTWESLSVELRPTEDRTGTRTVTPTYLRRRFTYVSAEQFIGVITLFADDYGHLPLMEFEFKGSLRWGGPHPIAEGAWCIDYVLDAGFGVTPLHEQAAVLLNQVPVHPRTAVYGCQARRPGVPTANRPPYVCGSGRRSRSPPGRAPASGRPPHTPARSRQRPRDRTPTDHRTAWHAPPARSPGADRIARCGTRPASGSDERRPARARAGGHRPAAARPEAWAHQVEARHADRGPPTTSMWGGGASAPAPASSTSSSTLRRFPQSPPGLRCCA